MLVLFAWGCIQSFTGTPVVTTTPPTEDTAPLQDTGAGNAGEAADGDDPGAAADTGEPSGDTGEPINNGRDTGAK